VENFFAIQDKKILYVMVTFETKVTSNFIVPSESIEGWILHTAKTYRLTFYSSYEYSFFYFEEHKRKEELREFQGIRRFSFDVNKGNHKGEKKKGANGAPLLYFIEN